MDSATGPPTTARRLAYALWLVVLLPSVFVVARGFAADGRYRDARHAVDVRFPGRVVATGAAGPGRAGLAGLGHGVVTVAWTDAYGRSGRQQFTVDHVGDFRVGDEFWIGWPHAEPTTVVALEREATDPTESMFAAAFLLALGLLGVHLPWLVRFIRWRRSRRAPAVPCRASLLTAFRRRIRIEPHRLIEMPWLRLEFDDEVVFQQVMWEPWLSSLETFERLEASGRGGRWAGIVVDVPGYGTLWPAGSAHASEPTHSAFRPVGRSDMAATTRVPGLTVAFLALFVVVAIVFGDIPAALAAGGQGALAVLYVGGGGLRRTSDWLHRIGPRRRSPRTS